MTLINPIFSEWKSIGLELKIPMMYHTWVSGLCDYRVSSLALAKSLTIFYLKYGRMIVHEQMVVLVQVVGEDKTKH